MKSKYITILDFEVGRIFQYKLPKTQPFQDVGYEEFIINKGHNLNNIEWMAHDIKEIVDHTIKSTIKKDK